MSTFYKCNVYKILNNCTDLEVKKEMLTTLSSIFHNMIHIYLKITINNNGPPTV